MTGARREGFFFKEGRMTGALENSTKSVENQCVFFCLLEWRGRHFFLTKGCMTRALIVKKNRKLFFRGGYPVDPRNRPKNTFFFSKGCVTGAPENWCFFTEIACTFFAAFQRVSPRRPEKYIKKTLFFQVYLLFWVDCASCWGLREMCRPSDPRGRHLADRSNAIKIHLIIMPTFVDVPEIKLIRTDTTLDLSQKAEKVWFSVVPGKVQETQLNVIILVGMVL